MKTQLLLIGALSLASLPALAWSKTWDDAAFCASMKKHAAATNSVEKGVMIDPVTRNDGMTVECDSKIINFKKTFMLPASELENKWEEKLQKEWNGIYCTDPEGTEAMRNGWIIHMTITDANSAVFTFLPHCTIDL